jgi:hypothetical protein
MMNIIEAVKNLAAKEREVRKLEMLIEHVASLKEDELAKVLSALSAARQRSVFNATLRLGSASMPHEAPGETPQPTLSTRLSSSDGSQRLTTKI